MYALTATYRKNGNFFYQHFIRAAPKKKIGEHIKNQGCELKSTCSNKTRKDSDADTAKLTEETATATTESKKSRNRRKRQ